MNDMIQDGDTILINNSSNTTISINNGSSFTTVIGLSPGGINKSYLGKINNTWWGRYPIHRIRFRYSTNGGTKFSNGTIPRNSPFTIKNITAVLILISSSSGIYQSTDGIYMDGYEPSISRSNKRKWIWKYSRKATEISEG
ncbi:MAG: hypothetical protein IPJ26_09150 [Bacteroidetes bacterium]|nr:hypothetical protein [Bacteroidota bacterium]